MTKFSILSFGVVLAAAVVQASPVRLRCEFRVNPLGIDAGHPSLSWQNDASERNWIQSAWQVEIASTPDLLQSGKPDVWDSGKQNGGESTGIHYAGPALLSKHRYYWSVRVWDAKGRPSESKESAWWEMGLLTPSDWSAHWIGWTDPQRAADQADIRWIWLPGQDALHVPPGSSAQFHLDFPIAKIPNTAAVYLMARGDWDLKVNGTDVANKKSWEQFDRQEIGSLVHEGTNRIDISVQISSDAGFGRAAGPRPGALAALLKINNSDGSVQRIPSGARWMVQSASGREATPAAVVGDVNDPQFGTPPASLSQPAAYLRHAFTIDKPVLRARAYFTALGAYELSINGSRAGTGVLMPGFTDFRKRVEYQTIDVTSLLARGQNVAAASLGAGWYASPLSWTAQHFVPKPEPLLRGQIEIEFTDGSRQSVITDATWRTSSSPILHSEIYAGETYDARLEQPAWQTRDFQDAAWQPAMVDDSYRGNVSSQPDAPSQVITTIKPEAVRAFPDKTYVFDMGQNMVGWAALKVKGKAGTAVRMRFAEILNPDGSIYRTNLRNADATDIYILRGGAEEVFRPRFTFHGFRYVELSGYPGTPDKDTLTGEVVSSLAEEPTAAITTSSELINRMWKLGIWGQRGNFLSVPTDCPQRDERLGWMADAAVFWRTGSYNFDIAAFTHKWLLDVNDAQSAEGAFSNVSPSIGVGTVEGAPGWGDAGVIVPWTTWMQYGDRGVIERSWAAMERWMQFIASNNPDFVRRKKLGPNFADWLAPDTTTPTELTDTAYWALIADMMTQMAHATGKDEASQHYAEVYEQIKAGFAKVFVHPNGEVGSGSQTGYILALQMKLLSPEMEAAAVNNLVKNIEVHDGHLTTGFLGTPFLLFSLADHGRADVAYRLLLNETYPSWGYMLSKGATTWWERWNGDSGDPAMNSYNHYAFGSVVAWIYQCVAGIDTVSSSPGFHQIVIHPRTDPRITEAQAHYDSVYGRIETEWRQVPNSAFTLRVKIPANTTAKIIFPGKPGGRVMEGKKTMALTDEAGMPTVQVGSGSYEFKMVQ